MTTIKFRAERDTLLGALAAPVRAAAARGMSLPVLGGVRVEAGGNRLVITGTDLETSAITAVDADTEGEGTTVVPARLTNDIIRALEPGVVTVTVDNAHETGAACTIQCGRTDFEVRTLPADEFPRLEQADLNDGVLVDAAAFGAALGQVVAAASSDDARPILTGVLLSSQDGNLRLVATDSYRLALKDVAGIGALADSDRLIPAHALAEIHRLIGKTEGQMRVIFGGRYVTFVIGDTILTTVLIEGAFPPYQRLIPDNHPNELTVDREHFVSVIARIALLARDATPVRMGMSDDGVEVRAVTQDVGMAVEQVDAIYKGTDLTIAFNPVYLKAGLEACTGDTVTVHSIDALKPALLRSQADPTFTYLLMPVRVQ